jgi:hypothetical protein
VERGIHIANIQNPLIIKPIKKKGGQHPPPFTNYSHFNKSNQYYFFFLPSPNILDIILGPLNRMGFIKEGEEAGFSFTDTIFTEASGLGTGATI